MAASLDGYLAQLRARLRPALCLHNFPSQKVPGHNNKPEIELQSCPELLLPPVTVARSAQEFALVEQSVNSTRISFKFRTTDATEEYLLRTFLRFAMHRADQLDIVRRVAVEGYDLSFLITNAHLERYHREQLIDFVCKFVEDLYSEISSMKLSLRSRARAVVSEYWQQLEGRHDAAAAAAAAAGVAR